jgi:hypothetical protein
MYDGKPKCARSPVDSVRAVATVLRVRIMMIKKTYARVPHSAKVKE